MAVDPNIPRVEEDFAEYEIRVDFTPGSQDPARIFESMAGMIGAFDEFDAHLAASISAKLRPISVLGDIRTSSLIAKLRVLLESIDDEALRELDWKKLVGSYLVRGKKLLVEWLRKREQVETRSELEELRDKLLELARETNVLWIDIYEPIPVKVLVADLLKLERSFYPLQESDRVVFAADGDEIEINTSFIVSEGPLEELAADKIVLETRERVMAVKKPDYLGRSMWEMRDQGHTVEVKILDEGWLDQFQNREVLVRPGDSLRAVVHTKVGFDENNQVIFSHYEVQKVEEVIPKPRWRQGTLFGEGEE